MVTDFLFDNYCLCGCGVKISPFQKYLKGHHGRNKSISEKTRKAVAEANRIRVWTDDSRHKVALGAIGRKQTEEAKMKISIANTGRIKSQETCEKISRNRRGIPVSLEIRQQMSLSRKGRPSPKGMLGKKHSKDTIQKMATKRSISMSTWQAAHLCSLIKNPSKPQVDLFSLVKALREDAVMNYPCGRYCIDIAIPSSKIAIEYDGSYWHQDPIKDQIRQEHLEAKGWKFIRYRDYVPSVSELVSHLEEKAA